MKRLLLVLALLCAQGLMAQTSYSCTARIYCFWSEVDEGFSDCADLQEESSLFVMNKGRTMFTHTTEEIKSTYYVESSELLDSGLRVYYVVSDVGNHYMYAFDSENKEIRCLINYTDGTSTLLTFVVKAIF